MSAPKSAEDCIVWGLPFEEPLNYEETVANIESYAAEEVRKATEALKAENADLRARLEAISESFVLGEAFNDERLDYIEVQIDRVDKERIDLALDLSKPFKEGA